MEHTGARLLRIGEVARLLGLTPKTILYYEQRRLLRPAARSEAGHRLYSDKEVARLQFIERAKLLGLELAEIKKLVDLADVDSRGEIIPRPEDLPRLEEVLEEKLRETERKMKELSAFREDLLRYRQRLEQEDES